MKAAIFEEFGGPLSVCDVPDPKPEPGSVVLEVKANGICRSDWHAWQGHDPEVKLPHVPGHELAGVVRGVGKEVYNWQVGDRVTVPFACGCGTCRYCRQGHLHICDNHFQPGFTAWGSFAQYVAVAHADANLVRLPDSVDFVTAASLGCRFATAYRAVVQQGRIRDGEWVAVHGCGGVGLSATMIARAFGGRIIGVDVSTAKLELARALGAEVTLDAGKTKSVARAIREATAGGADLSLDALGSRTTCRNSIRCLRKQGRHVQVGLLLGDQAEPPLPMAVVVARELEILGSHGLSARDYPPLLERVRTGQLDPTRLVTRRISLEEAPRELERMGRFETQGITVIDRFSG